MSEEFDGETYESNRIIQQLIDIEEHCLDGSAVLQGCSCIQDRHLQGLTSAAKQYGSIAVKQENRQFGADLAVYAETRLKTVYDFHQKHTNEDTKAAWSFYLDLAKEVRAIRKAFDANEPFPKTFSTKHTIKCGCKGCPPCV
jgi:hypothetical protein